LIEKAAAKLYNNDDAAAAAKGWEQCESGFISIGLNILSGQAARNCRHIATSERIISGKLWKDILRFVNKRHLVGAASAGASDTQVSEGNIVQAHAFSILDARAINGFQLLKLRNPWGHTEWTGDWSDESPLWETYPNVAKELNNVVQDDGIFWITMKDYLRFYDSTSFAFSPSSVRHPISKDSKADSPRPKLEFSELDAKFADGCEYTGGFGREVGFCLQANLVTSAYADIALTVTTPFSAIPASSDIQVLLIPNQKNKRLHTPQPGGPFILIKKSAGENGESNMIYLPPGSYSILVCYAKSSGLTEAHLYPLAMKLSTAKEDQDYVVRFEKAPEQAAVRAPERNLTNDWE
jgi:hypothetical protein